MKISAALPPGVSALFFDAAARRRALEARLAEELRAGGFSEVILPILDYLEPYGPLMTAAGRGELYRFSDRDGEQLALRSDFTPMLARLVAPQLPRLELPQRFFYAGDVVRYEEDRPGRQRESYQIGAELLGLPGAEAPRELLHLFLRLLSACGAQGVRVVLGFAGALDELLLGSAAEGGGAALAEAVARRERQSARDADPVLLEVVRDGIPGRPETLGRHAAGLLRDLVALRDELAAELPGIELVIDLAEFARFTLDESLWQEADERGYYDGLLFRAYAPGGARLLGGGGRYDSLFKKLDPELSLSAVGFFLALDRILAAGSEAGGAR